MSIYDLEKETQIRVFLETNRALLGRIGPEVRAISLDYDGRTVYLCIYSECELSENDKEEFDIATTEIIAGMIRIRPTVVRFFVVPMPKKIPIRGEVFFQRKEAFNECV